MRYFFLLATIILSLECVLSYHLNNEQILLTTKSHEDPIRDFTKEGRRSFTVKALADEYAEKSPVDRGFGDFTKALDAKSEWSLAASSKP